MEIEDKGTLTKFETIPTEGTLYLTAVRYPPCGWMNGPSGMDKARVISDLRHWDGIDMARIYAVPVPLAGYDS